MKVTLIDYTGAGTTDPADYAASVLIFTKSTRLQMAPGLLDDIRSWSMEKKLVELEYMANTIPSSWEFCHYSFLISDVTRAFTHQLVRTRSASFAQQTLRVLNVDGWKYATGPSIRCLPKRFIRGRYPKDVYDTAMRDIAKTYSDLVEGGIAIEDARGILPTNILTNICVSMNLRTFCEMVYKRTSPRVQGEYRAVLEEMKQRVLEVHPFVKLFIDRTFDRAAVDLDKEIDSLPVDNEKKISLRKLVDQLRQKQ